MVILVQWDKHEVVFALLVNRGELIGALSPGVTVGGRGGRQEEEHNTRNTFCIIRDMKHNSTVTWRSKYRSPLENYYEPQC